MVCQVDEGAFCRLLAVLNMTAPNRVLNPLIAQAVVAQGELIVNAALQSELSGSKRVRLAGILVAVVGGREVREHHADLLGQEYAWQEKLKARIVRYVCSGRWEENEVLEEVG